MHTRAADSQSLCDHLLAYVKQNFSPARSDTLRIGVLTVALIIAFTLLGSACGTLPRHASSATHAGFEEPEAETASRININAASALELEKLPGVGKVIAERIIAHRMQYGPFRRPEHLMMVRGISDRKFRDLRDLIATE